MLDALSITEIVIARNRKPCRDGKVKGGGSELPPEVGIRGDVVEFRFNV